MICGFCDGAWDIICGFASSKTSLLDWIDMCRCPDGTDERLFQFVDGSNGNLDRTVEPPEYHPNRSHTPIHKTRYPGPYQRWPEQRAPRKERRVTVPETPADGDIEWLEV